MAAMTVSALYVYPIKSCGRLSLDQAAVSVTGFKHDRRWQLVDAEGTPINQRQHPVLATVQPELLDDGLSIGAAGRDAIEVPSPTSATRSVSSHLGVPVDVGDAGDDAAAWFSTLLGVEARLVGLVGEGGWQQPPALDYFDQPAPFADAAPLLITTEASLRWLQDRADEPFGMDRFRPNVVVAGARPWEEDSWQSIQIGQASVRGVFPWPRCAIPQVDQQSGERRKEPARVLKRHRWCTEAPTLPAGVRPMIEGSGLFGLACSIGEPGSTVGVGDVVTVEQTTDPVLVMDG